MQTKGTGDSIEIEQLMKYKYLNTKKINNRNLIEEIQQETCEKCVRISKLILPVITHANSTKTRTNKTNQMMRTVSHLEIEKIATIRQSYNFVNVVKGIEKACRLHEQIEFRQNL